MKTFFTVLFIMFVWLLIFWINYRKESYELKHTFQKIYNLWFEKHSGEINKKELLRLLKKEKVCSKYSTDWDITNKNWKLTIKCNKWFTKNFINYLNKFNCDNENSNRNEQWNCFMVEKRDFWEVAIWD